MDEIEHKFLQVIKWSSLCADSRRYGTLGWRHQRIAMASAGYRAIAPDHRGYGLSDPPPEPAKCTYGDIILDLLGSSVVLFVHGFPEIWYSWRHQMIAVVNAGYRAIAPDLRGYGFSEHDSELENASFNDFVDDTVAILDHFQIEKVFLVGKDFGSWPVYLLSLLHPNRVSGIVSLGVPFFPPNPNKYKSLPEGFYMTRWKEPGQAEADFGRFDVKTVWKNIYILFSRSEIPIAAKDKEIMDMVDPSTPLPPWLTKEDLATYATFYEKSGFIAPLQVPYRSLHKEFTINNPKVGVPVLLIMGGKDYILKFPGIEEYITSGKVQEYVPDLEVKNLPEGTHFVQEQFPDHVNQLILSFLDKHG